MNPTPAGLRIVYRHLDPSDALSQCIEHEFDHLSKLCRLPMTCHVTVERGDRFGAPDCEVRLQLNVQGTPLVVNQVPDLDEETDPYTEIRDAFRVARRLVTHHMQTLSPRSGERVTTHLPR